MPSIDYKKIVFHPDLQQRERTDDDHIEDIALAIQKRAKIKPPRVIQVTDRGDGEAIFAIDWHRCKAYELAGRKMVPVRKLVGTWQEARDLASSANIEHTALKRTVADKRRAACMAFEDHPDWSDSAVATHCGISPTYAAECRKLVEKAASVPADKRVASDGSTWRAAAGKKGGTTTKRPKRVRMEGEDCFDDIIAHFHAASRQISDRINREGGEKLLKYLQMWKLIEYPKQVIVNGEKQNANPRFKGFPGICRIIRLAALPGKAKTEDQVRQEFHRKEEGEQP